MTLEQITLDRAVCTLKMSASIIKMAKDLLPPEKAEEMDLDNVIARNLELATKARELSDEMSLTTQNT